MAIRRECRSPRIAPEYAIRHGPGGWSVQRNFIRFLDGRLTNGLDPQLLRLALGGVHDFPAFRRAEHLLISGLCQLSQGAEPYRILRIVRVSLVLREQR